MAKKIVFLLSIIFVLFHVLTPIFGVIPGIGQKSIHLGLILVIYFLSSLGKRESSKSQKIIDLLFILASVGSTLYLMKIDSTLDFRSGIVYKSDVFFGVLLIITLIEATRRTVGLSLALVSVFFIIYGFVGPYLPGFLSHPGLRLGRLINIVYMTSDGIFGIALYASSTYIVLFIILGCLFQETGIGDFFTDLATSVFGRVRGGPAKVAVVASGFFGSISGSAIANVISTGTFTIPLMKSSGFEPEYAGGVEAAASTGGQIMPPIMGATAFLIAEILGIPYFDLVKAALIPAILFFAAILMTVDLYARKKTIEGIDKEKIPSLRKLLKQSHLFIPLVFLIVMLGVLKSTIMKAGIFTILVTAVVVMFKQDTRLNKDKLIKIVSSSVSGAMSVAIACAIVGIIIGVLMSSGLGFRISSILIDIASGNLPILLVLTMLVSLIMGMGMPTTAAYLVLAILVAPAMIEMGVAPLAAHLFIFYFGIISNITPPVALAAYAAAGVARCNPNKTGIQAFKLALSGFILPFMFVYNPVLLFEGAWYKILIAFATSLIGVYCLSCGLEKYIIAWHVNFIERIMLFAAALMLINNGAKTDIFGIVLVVIVILLKTVGAKAFSNIISIR